jgi:hypothetical protein
VKYWAPWSKLPKGELRVAMRPPGETVFSNTVTLWPACTRVRAQAMPAMPAPITAKCRGPRGACGMAVSFRCVDGLRIVRTLPAFNGGAAPAAPAG